MRNKYAGMCYRCHERVEVGDGHFEKIRGTRHWRTIHDHCVYEQRKEKEQAKIDEELKRIAQFKVGSKVRFVNDKKFKTGHDLIIGNVYTVVQVVDGGKRIKLEESTTVPYNFRFEVLEQG